MEEKIKELSAEIERLNKKSNDYERGLEMALEFIPERNFGQGESVPNEIHATIKKILHTHKDHKNIN